MPFIVSTHNLAAGLPASAWSIEGMVGPGLYPVSNLASGSMAVPWRTSVRRSWWSIELDLGSAQEGDVVALFDVRPSNGTILGATIWDAFGRTVGGITVGPRGDGAALLESPVMSQRWGIGLQLSQAASLHIGEIWVGQATRLPRSFTELDREQQYSTVQNGEFGAEREPMREALTWVWPALRPDDAAAMRAVLRRSGGPRDPVVVMPSSAKPTEVYLGRLTPPRTTLHLGPFESGHAIQFQEGRRALG